MQYFTFRLAQNDDLSAIVDIWRENIADEMPNKQMLESAQDILVGLFNTRHDYYNYWVAVDTETQSIIGWQSYFPVFCTPLKKATTVESSTYIDKKYHKYGVATHLMSFALSELKKSDLQLVYGFVKDTNVGIQKIIVKLGFTKAGMIPDIGVFPFNHLKLLYIYQVHQ